MVYGSGMIRKERYRQIVKGRSTRHDLPYVDGDLAVVAAVLATDETAAEVGCGPPRPNRLGDLGKMVREGVK